VHQNEPLGERARGGSCSSDPVTLEAWAGCHMALSSIGPETVRILERGEYVAPSGKTVDLRACVQKSVQGTVLYTLEALELLLAKAPTRRHTATSIEVTSEATGAAARRLAEREGCGDVVALNFASAKNPGGGFLGGARAQEEALARCSGLYPCLLAAPGYYEAHRRLGSPLYSHRMIYSPRVTFFRDEEHALLDEPFAVSVITSAAPNAGAALARDPEARPAITEALTERARRVLAVAEAHGHHCLVLGAWGCGVFRNDPREVAGAFGDWLESDRFRGSFGRVVFAVFTARRSDEPNLRAFERRFGI
jgi:uncharacterized protein (TIGR02452 family)